MHQSYGLINLNLYLLARAVPPSLAIIDGLEGMEGDGPVGGNRVNFDLAIASTDFVAADSLAARLMGFEPRDIGYLFYCHEAGLGQADVSVMDILGDGVETCARPFRPHPTYQAQLDWRVPGVERYLNRR